MGFMMATITTKYSEGDTVYFASTQSEKRKHDCPDCLGQKKWKTVSPAGGAYEFDCPRCAASYLSNSKLSLVYQAYVPAVSKLTIGSVQFNTAEGAYDQGARYMCRETGVGSGTVYNETDLFISESNAMDAARLKAEEQNATIPVIVERYNATLKLSDYQLESAMIEIGKGITSNARELLYNIQELQNDTWSAIGKKIRRRHDNRPPAPRRVQPHSQSRRVISQGNGGGIAHCGPIDNSPLGARRGRE
jgi:hypothetical protein